ncbi:MAG TPA: CvpA family protein [Bryobacteraceae bacterium]|nr:CvpA family protein [Bryobacteraceae bacterium]
MNWVDWLLIAFLLISIANGFQEGMVRITIGFIAMIAGFFLASWFGGLVAGSLLPWVSSKAAASIFGYLLVFIGVLILGGLLGLLISRMLKLIGLSWMDRLFGAALGVARGFVVLAVVTMVITALAPKWLPSAVRQSQYAPYVLRAADVLTELTPFEIRDGFDRAYAEIRKLKLHK